MAFQRRAKTSLLFGRHGVGTEQVCVSRSCSCCVCFLPRIRAKYAHQRTSRPIKSSLAKDRGGIRIPRSVACKRPVLFCDDLIQARLCSTSGARAGIPLEHHASRRPQRRSWSRSTLLCMTLADSSSRHVLNLLLGTCRVQRARSFGSTMERAWRHEPNTDTFVLVSCETLFV